MDCILKYSLECVSICTHIISLQNPLIIIEPLHFEPLNNNKIFNNNNYVASNKSINGNYLNYIVWPSIIKCISNDEKSIVSKPFAFFSNNIIKLQENINETQKDELKTFFSDSKYKINSMEYYNLFKQHGFNDMDIFKELTDDDLMSIGMEKKAHRMKILRGIKILNIEMDKANKQ
eukprot:71816_1